MVVVAAAAAMRSCPVLQSFVFLEKRDGNGVNQSQMALCDIE